MKTGHRAPDPVAKELAHSVIESVAASELEAFDEISEAFFANPKAVLKRPRGDQQLGFGIESLLVTPVVLAIAVEVVKLLGTILVDEAVDMARDKTASEIRRFLRSRKKPGTAESQSGSQSGSLSASQLARVETEIRDVLRSHPLPKEAADSVTKAFIDRLTQNEENGAGDGG